MKIRLSLSDLNEAIDLVSIVRPSSEDNRSAYIFNMIDGHCYVHSQDGLNYIRAEVPVLDLEEDSQFLFPADRTAALKHAKGWITIESGQDGGSAWVKHATEDGTKITRTTYDPKSLEVKDTSLGGASTEYAFPTALLRDAIGVASNSMAVQEDHDKPYQTLQIFDKSLPAYAEGDGIMYAADGNRACYYYSPDLAGKGFAISSKHINRLSSFLSKCGKGVKMRLGDTMTFVVDQVPGEDGATRDGAIFGWVHHAKLHPKYSYYPAKFDKYVLRVPRGTILGVLRRVRDELKDADQAKIRVIYENKFLKFMGSIGKETIESALVGVHPLPLVDGADSGPNFAANANVHNLIGLFESCRSDHVELRVAFVEGKKALFRTVEQFWLSDNGKALASREDSKESCCECKVTHFSTSMD